MEIMFPVEDPKLKEKVLHILEVQLRDTVKAHLLQPEGSYEKVDRRGKETFNSQEAFCIEAVQAAMAQADPHDGRVFIPEVHMEMEEEA